MAKHLGLNIQAVTNAEGEIDESTIDIEDPSVTLVFSSLNPLPENALVGLEAIEEAMRNL